MAPTTSRLLPVALAPLLGLQAVAATSLQWQGEIEELDLRALSDTEVDALSSVYAQEVAATLGVEAKDVHDMNGRSSLVTLIAPSVHSEDVGSDLRTSTTTDRVSGWSSSSPTTTPKWRTSSPTTPPPITTGVQTSSRRPVSTVALANASRSLRPIRGVSYGALPCTRGACKFGLPSSDMLQVGYQNQWGAEGRDDLGIMARLGANVVRLYHSLGLRVNKDHSAFLDHAGSLGLTVLPGYHTDLAIDPAACPDFDCYETWKEATLNGFQHGYKQGDEWHSAIGGLVLLNEPDFFASQPKCAGRGSVCHLKASLSALDGVLAAEREAGLTSTEKVKLTVAWSFATRTSVDGKVTGPALYGFQDIVAGIKEPQLAGYTPRSSLEQLSEAFRTRWVHSLNTQAPWSFVAEMINQNYEQFLPTPWFIAEYGATGQGERVIRQDLEAMQSIAEEGGAFIGVSFFRFQAASYKGGSEMNFGLFELTGQPVLQTSRVCDDRVRSTCRTWPVHCLSPEVSLLAGSMGRRANAVAAAWGGVVDVSSSVCGKGRRLATQPIFTKLACEVKLGASADREAGLAAISSNAFARDMVSRTLAALGADNAAVQGTMRLIRTSVVMKEGGKGFDGKMFGLAMVVAVFFGVASTVVVVGMHKRRKAVDSSGEVVQDAPGV